MKKHKVEIPEGYKVESTMTNAPPTSITINLKPIKKQYPWFSSRKPTDSRRLKLICDEVSDVWSSRITEGKLYEIKCILIYRNGENNDFAVRIIDDLGVSQEIQEYSDLYTTRMIES